MSKIILTTEYKGEPIYITHVAEGVQYVLVSKNQTELNKLFKLEVDALNLSDKDKAALTKAQLKNQL